MADELIAIASKGASPGLSARIHPLGAELWSLADGQGREYMTDADPAFWTGHAPLLFPIVGGLNGGQYRLGERSYELARHGFARRSQFAVVDQGEDHVRLRLSDTEATRAVYPFAFVLDMAFRVEGASLRMTASVTNAGDVPMPFSFGYHPAFAWPLPGGARGAAHRIVFEREEGAAVRRLDRESGALLPQGQASPVQGRELLLDAALFAEDAMIWTQLASRSLSYGADGGPWLDIDFPDTPYLGLWQVPGAHYLCIEPWAGHADPQGFAGDFTQKPGIETLAPGETRSFRMDVSVRAG